jgi:hypothetical protein
MAIQLNERDQLIFKMIDEHQVLLEKHISWFISGEDKPVLIRDRLRKLFYLDYLLCQRHNTKLPWWTTPTKPLVYMLSPMSRQEAASDETNLDLLDSNVQRHFLEVANVRMLCLIAQKEGEISEFEWRTCSPSLKKDSRLDAIIDFKMSASSHKVGIINHPTDIEKLVSDLEVSFKADAVETILVISRDDLHQKSLQQALSTKKDRIDLNKVLFVTHHELYKSGITKACWLKADQQVTSLLGAPISALTEAVKWAPGFSGAPIASAM